MTPIKNALLAVSILSSSSTALAESVPGQTVLRLTPAAYRELQSHPREFLDYRVLKQIPALRTVLLATPAVLTAAQFKGAPGVQTATPNQIVHAAFTPNDPLFNSQWGLGKINMQTAWELGRGTVATPVAIVDTGIQHTHPDLTATYMSGGYDFVNADNDPMDDFGHGTLVAGIVSAATNNSEGIAGIGFGCPVIGIKVLNAGGGGTSFDVAQGISFAVTDTPARVINISLGSPTPDVNIEAACQLAADNGVVVIAAAGNSNSDAPFYPAYYRTCVAVGATDQDDLKLDISNFGPSWVHVAAPGKEILSTNLGSGYGGISGTSMAAPAVAGLAALLYERLGPGRTTLKAALVRSWICAGAQDVASWTTFGRIDASESLRFARNVSPVSFTWSPYGSNQPGLSFTSTSDSAGNVYAAFSQGQLAQTDIAIEKRDAQGNLVWKRMLDGAGMEDKVSRIAVDATGRVFVCGYSYKDPFTTDALVACYSSTGVQTWKKLIDSPTHKNELARSLALTSDKVFVVGSYTVDAATNTNATVWVFRMTDGTLVSSKQFNGTGNKDDYAEDIVMRPDGKAYVAVTAKTPTSRNAYVLLYTQPTNSFTTLAGYNGAGDSEDFAVKLKLANTGDVFLAGLSDDGSIFQDTFLARVRSTGGFAWSKVLPGSLASIETDATDSVYWCGYEARSVLNSSIIVYKMDGSTGSTSWKRRIGGLGNVMEGTYDNAGVACMVSGGSLLVSATTDGPTKSDATTLWFNSTSGKLLRVARYDAGGANETCATLSVSPTSKNVFVGCLSAQAAGTQARFLKYAP